MNEREKGKGKNEVEGILELFLKLESVNDQSLSINSNSQSVNSM